MGYFVTPGDVGQIEMAAGVLRRTMATTDEAMLCEFWLERGTEIPPHSHRNDQVGYLVFGRLQITIGSETRLLQPGDSYAIPGGVTHSAMAEVDSLAIDVFSPPRRDYLSEAR